MIDRLFSEDELQSGLVCRAFSRHLFDGHVFEERRQGGHPPVAWVARLECIYCGTKRVTPMMPETFVPLYENSPHTYTHGEHYDSSIDPTAARKTVMKRMMSGGPPPTGSRRLARSVATGSARRAG